MGGGPITQGHASQLVARACAEDNSNFVRLQTQKDFKFNIHFWLGKGVSPDEGGVATLKTVELDCALGGRSVQYREVQEHESKQFLSYFVTGIRCVKNMGINRVVE